MSPEFVLILTLLGQGLFMALFIFLAHRAKKELNRLRQENKKDEINHSL